MFEWMGKIRQKLSFMDFHLAGLLLVRRVGGYIQ